MSEENVGNQIQIGIKVRPMSKREINLQLKEQWEVNGNSIHCKKTQNHFTFDYLFGSESRNSDIYNAIVAPIVQLSLEGYNGTIFAYGQTSSGKTHTMTGNDDDPGVMIMAIRHLFQGNDSLPERKFLIRVGYLEIYNENILDLLSDRKQIRFCHKSDLLLTNKEVIVTNEEALIKILYEGNKIRKAASTKMNQFSSRSHTIFQIIIESEDVNGSVQISHLNLVDLAGSERAEDVVASEYQKNELKYINKSLLELSLAIKCLSNGEKVNTDSSKLNKILRDALGGNANAAIICNVATFAEDQTALTLSFANQAKNVKNLPVCNEDSKGAALMKKIKTEIAILKLRLNTHAKGDKLGAQIAKKESIFLMSKNMRPRAEQSTMIPLQNVIPSNSSSTSISPQPYPTFERINTQLVLKLSPCFTLFQDWHHSMYHIGDLEEISQQRVMRVTNATKYSDYYLERVGFELNTILRKNLKIGKNVIGRSEETNDVDIHVDTQNCSRKHCVITVSDGTALIKDLNSSNGTTINGVNKKGVTVELRERDLIGIGNQTITENDLVGNFRFTVYRLCKYTSENLPTFQIEDDENNEISHDDTLNNIKCEISNKRKDVYVEHSNRVEKRCKTIVAPDCRTENSGHSHDTLNNVEYDIGNKRKEVPVEHSNKVEERCKTTIALDCQTANYNDNFDIEPTLENIDLIQLMTDLTSIDQTGCCSNFDMMDQSSEMPIVENVDNLLEQLLDTQGTEMSNSNEAISAEVTEMFNSNGELSEMTANYTSAKQTIVELENEIQKLKQTLSMNEKKEVKSIEENKKRIAGLESELLAVIEKNTVLQRQNSKMLTKINDAKNFQVKFDRNEKENSKLKTQLKEFSESVQMKYLAYETDLRNDKTELKQLKEKNDFLSKTVDALKPLQDKNRKLLQSVQKLAADNLKLVQNLDDKTLAYDKLKQTFVSNAEKALSYDRVKKTFPSNALLTGMDGHFSSATQAVVDIQNEIRNIKLTKSTYEQTIKILKLKEALHKANEQVDDMEAALKRRIQRFDDECTEKCSDFQGMPGDNSEKVENGTTAGQTESTKCNDSVDLPTQQLGELIGNVVHVDVLPEGNHRIVMRQLDGNFSIFDVTQDELELLQM